MPGMHTYHHIMANLPTSRLILKYIHLSKRGNLRAGGRLRAKQALLSLRNYCTLGTILQTKTIEFQWVWLQQNGCGQPLSQTVDMDYAGRLCGCEKRTTDKSSGVSRGCSGTPAHYSKQTNVTVK